MSSPQVTYLDSELELSSLESARFTWAGGDYRGKPLLGPEVAEELLVLESEHEAYGLALYEAVFPRHSELREGLREAILAAEREKSRLRFRLHLSLDLPDWVHGLYWELLSDPDRHLALARSPDTAFSRYLDARRAQGAPAPGRPRLLCVISAPSNVARYGLAEIRRDEVLQSLQAAFGALSDDVEVEFLEPPATLGRLRDRLMQKKGFQLLHFFGHGERRGGVSSLVLEDEQGRVQFVEEKLLAEVFLGVRELRLVTLVACHGGAPSSGDPFSGLAGRLVQRGVPSVLAMRRAVRVESAHLFTEHLYRHIAQTGRADAAVNEARQQLFLAWPGEIDWSSPVLYSRLSDSRLWLPQAEAGDLATREPLLQPSFRRLLHPLPWVPAVLALALFGLGLWPAPKAEMRLDLQASQVAFRLAKSAAVVERLDLEELAATRLAAVRLPSSLPVPGSWNQARGGALEGFLLAARDAGAHVTLNTLPLPAGTEVVLEHQGGSAYRLSLSGAKQELTATFQGDVLLKRLDAPALPLHQKHPESLVLYPQSGAVDIDLLFRLFAQDNVAREIPVDRLSLRRVVEQHTLQESMVREESTLLAGTVYVRGAGQRHVLKPREILRCASLAGSLTGVRLGEDGIRLGFQGRIAGLERGAEGLQSASLMPTYLDLWIAGPAQVAVQGACGALAAAALLLTFLGIRPFRLVNS